MKLKLNNSGQTLVEYVMIIAFIAVAAIAAVKVFGGILKDKMTEVSCELLGEEYIQGKKRGEAYCQEEGLETFNSN